MDQISIKILIKNIIQIRMKAMEILGEEIAMMEVSRATNKLNFIMKSKSTSKWRRSKKKMKK